jgi:hypothetical protein
MKKTLMLLALAGLFVACETESDDSTYNDPDPDPTPPAGSADIVINELTYLQGEVEVYNRGNASADISDYFLCLGPGTYVRVGDIITSGSANLQPGQFAVLNYDRSGETGGLGLYRNNAGFGDAANLVSFVQWGAAGSPRENVAADAGLWTAGDFIQVTNSEDNSIAYDGTGTASSDWAETSTVTLGQTNVVTAPEETASVIINEVEYLINDQIELYNDGTIAVDLSDYWMCLGPGMYFRVGNSANTNIVSGNTLLQPGEFLVISPINLSVPDAAGGLGLYVDNSSFGNAETIRSFVQWGNAGNARENVAVGAGIWNAGEFIPNVASGNSIAYDGSGFAASDWTEATPSLGQSNSN